MAALLYIFPVGFVISFSLLYFYEQKRGSKPLETIGLLSSAVGAVAGVLYLIFGS